jgi:hypothetical protein
MHHEIDMCHLLYPPDESDPGPALTVRHAFHALPVTIVLLVLAMRWDLRPHAAHPPSVRIVYVETRQMVGF